ncbi:MAG TPA: hypothetical protein VK421_21080 [Pyrinomonadaceae bacterium]|nr:hypothetical protein [Pyrinomonadaceae bacterium]
MQELQFENVWYRPEESRWRDMELVAYRDSGRLVVRADSLEFYGRSARVIVRDARGVALVKQGRDFINDWVRVEYGDPANPSTAFFADGSWLGWGGILGGTRRIFEAVRHVARRP